MKRREFISVLGGAAAWPLAVRAQPRERMRRIGLQQFYPFRAHSGLWIVLPTKFDLLVNLKTAKALGLDVPSTPRMC